MAITGTIAMVGAGMASSAYGAYQQQEGYDKMQEGQAIQQAGYAKMSAASEQVNQLQKLITQDEMKQEGLRRQAMEIDASRNRIQVLRQAQQARAMGVAAAVNQGAFYGSGLQGGTAQVSGAAGFNLLGISQNLDMGRKNFDINADISQQKLGIADQNTILNQGQGQVYQGQGVSQAGQGMVQMGSGFMSMGSSLMGAASSFSNIAGNFKGFGGTGMGGYGGSNPMMGSSPGMGMGFTPMNLGMPTTGFTR